MKVIRAKSRGFCWGVERAIQVAREEACGGERRVHTDGPLIHNKQMMDALSREDIREVGDYQQAGPLSLPEEEGKDSVVVVRAHGISPQRRKYLKELGLFGTALVPTPALLPAKSSFMPKRGMTS